MKFKWHAQMKKHELMIAILKCKTCVKKLMRLKMNNGSCILSKNFTIQMSPFLYWLNLATIIRISYPKKSNRVQSRSCLVSLIKLDIVALNLKSMKFLLGSMLNSKSVSVVTDNLIILIKWFLVLTNCIAFIVNIIIVKINNHKV